MSGVSSVRFRVRARRVSFFYSGQKANAEENMMTNKENGTISMWKRLLNCWVFLFFDAADWR